MRPACAIRSVNRKKANNGNAAKNLKTSNLKKGAALRPKQDHTGSCRNSKCSNKRGSVLDASLPRKAKISNSTANIARDHLNGKNQLGQHGNQPRNNSLELELNSLRKRQNAENKHNLEKNKIPTLRNENRRRSSEMNDSCGNQCKNYELKFDSEENIEVIKNVEEEIMRNLKPNVGFNLDRPDPSERRGSMLYQDNPDTEMVSFNSKLLVWIFAIFARLRSTQVTEISLYFIICIDPEKLTPKKRMTPSRL